MAIRMSRYGILLLGVTAFAVSFVSTAWAGLSQTLFQERTHLSTDEFGSWRYDAYRDGLQLTLEVKLENTTRDGLDAFRAANQRIAEDLLLRQDVIPVNVILRSPLSRDDVEQLAAQYGLQVSALQMRALDGRGDRVTLFLSPNSQDELIAMPIIDSLLSWPRKETGGAILLGVTTLEASIPSSGYRALATSPSVYLVDVTPAFVKAHFQQTHASLIRESEIIVVLAYPIYWYLEESRNIRD